MLLEINFTAVLFAVSFLIFIYLLNLTLYKPVGEIIEKRKNSIEGDYSNAKNLTEKAGNMLEAYKKEIKQARQESQCIIEEVIQAGQKKKEGTIITLLGTLNKEKENAIKQIQEEQKVAMKQIESQIKTLTDLITKKVLGMEGSLIGTH